MPWTLDIAILGNLRLLEESRQPRSCLATGSQSATAVNGFGILYMQGEYSFQKSKKKKKKHYFPWSKMQSLVILLWVMADFRAVNKLAGGRGILSLATGLGGSSLGEIRVVYEEGKRWVMVGNALNFLVCFWRNLEDASLSIFMLVGVDLAHESLDYVCWYVQCLCSTKTYDVRQSDGVNLRRYLCLDLI